MYVRFLARLPVLGIAQLMTEHRVPALLANRLQTKVAATEMALGWKISHPNRVRREHIASNVRLLGEWDVMLADLLIRKHHIDHSPVGEQQAESCGQLRL
jgi:hypothetical protein